MSSILKYSGKINIEKLKNTNVAYNLNLIPNLQYKTFNALSWFMFEISVCALTGM